MKPVGFVIGDSVPLPRAFEAGAPGLRETWPQLLIAATPSLDWIVNCRGGRTIAEVDGVLKTIVNYYRPTLTLLSVGIVDCSFRALQQRELDLLETIPYVARVLRPILRRHHFRITKRRRIPYIPPSLYRAALAKAVKYCGSLGTKLVFVQILPAGSRMRSTSFAIQENIARYNQIAAEFLPAEQVVDLDLLVPQIDDLVLPDGHHLNAAGHRACAERILERLGLLGFLSQ